MLNSCENSCTFPCTCHFNAKYVVICNVMCYTPICHVYSFCNKTFTHMYGCTYVRTTLKILYAMFVSVHGSSVYTASNSFKPPKGNFIFYNIKRFSSLYFLSVSEQFSNKINCQPITQKTYFFAIPGRNPKLPMHVFDGIMSGDFLPLIPSLRSLPCEKSF